MPDLGPADRQTPAVVSLSRSRRHTITCQLPGYQPASAALGLRASGWLWGDIVCLAPIGFLMDAASGGANGIEPGKSELTLQPDPREVGMDSARLMGRCSRNTLPARMMRPISTSS